MIREPIRAPIVRAGMRTFTLAAVTVAALAGCPGKTFNDAAVDLMFTGEVVDWDSTDANFCGVLGATLTVHGDPSRTDMIRAPNGRFLLAIASAPTTQIDLAPPTTGSGCITGSPTYAIPGIIVANRDVIAASAIVSLRMMTMPRTTTFYGALGGFDASKAQIFVHVDGTPRAVAISGTGGAPQAFDGTAWAAGATGVNVMFPNVDVGSGTTQLTMTGNATGTGMLPLAAGKFTYATVIAN
jgi:hypothetical protein